MSLPASLVEGGGLNSPMRSQFPRLVPAELQTRATAWVAGLGDLDDEVGAIWRRIDRGTLIGAGFGRDLFELRADPAAVWVAAFAVISGDDPVTTQLTTRAMFARFGADLLAPVETLLAPMRPARRGRVATALRSAANEQGTPPELRSRLHELIARHITRRVRREAEQAIAALELGDEAGADKLLLELWRFSRDPEVGQLLANAKNPLAGVLAAARAGDWPAADLLLQPIAAREGDPRMAEWLAPWVALHRESARALPGVAQALIRQSLPATRAIADQLDVVAPDPEFQPVDLAQIASLRELRAAAADPRPRQLWAEIHANPTDLTPRWILADLYTELGSPRGPFMAASLRALGTGRRPYGEAATLRRWEMRWAGAFGLELEGDRRWEGGVIVAAHIRSIGPYARPHPEWRLVEELHLDFAGGSLPMLTPAQFPRLRILGTLVADDLPVLADLPIVAQLEKIYVFLGVRFELTLRRLGAFPFAERVVLVVSDGGLRDFALETIPRPFVRAVPKIRQLPIAARGRAG